MYYETRKNKSLGIALILVLLVVIIAILISLIKIIENNSVDSSYKNIEATGTDTVDSEFSPKDLAKNSGYSVVGISKLNEKNTSVFVENSEEKLGIGSGLILTSNGLILSNCETTGGKGETCFVTLKNGTIYPGEVKWSDSNLDISIVKISAENLLFLTCGDSDNLEIGDKLYILSNSTGYEFDENFNELLISKVKTTLKLVGETETIYSEDVIKVNLDIGPSYNGGAILNKNGEVFGIASSKLNSVIPINRIKNILNRLKEDENFEEPYLGIYGFDNDVLKYLNPDYNLKIGIYVEKIDEESPLKDKILPGDIIRKVDDIELSSFQELSEYIYSKSIKDEINLNIIRGTKEINLEVILNGKPRPS